MGIDVLKLTIAGLVLATIAVVYLIFSQRFFFNTTREVDQELQKVDSLQVLTPTTTTPTPTPTPTSQQQLLPATGFPFISVVLFALSVTVSGWFLRKYPH